MNGAFVTALVPLSTVSAISNILQDKSMEEPRLVILDGGLHPLKQSVVYAKAQEAERIIGELAQRSAAGAAKMA